MSIINNKEICDICRLEIERKEGESSLTSFKDKKALHYHKVCHDNAETLVYGFIERFFWDLCWKLVAMWKASQRGSKIWFIILMIFNTLGILPIIYLLCTKEK